MYQHSIPLLTASVMPTIGHNRGCTTKPTFLWPVKSCSVVETYRWFWKISYVHLLHWRWSQQVPAQSWQISTRLHGVTSYKVFTFLGHCLRECISVCLLFPRQANRSFCNDRTTRW